MTIVSISTTPQLVAPPSAAHPVEHGWYGAASAHVARFLHRLRCIPANLWMEAVEEAPQPAAAAAAPEQHVVKGLTAPLLEEQADYAARRRLHEVMDAMPVVVKRIRRRIDHDLAVLEGIVPPGAMRRMRRAAHLAAFGLAAQPYLDSEDVARLYRPFEEIIPSQELIGA